MARKKNLSNHKIGALVRKRVEEIRRKFSVKFKIGDLVKEKYVKDNVGLVLQEVEAKKRVIGNVVSHFVPKVSNENAVPVDYLANRYYSYKVKVLWMHHPEVVAGELDQISDMNVHYLTQHKEKKEKKEKKVLETAKDL